MNHNKSKIYVSFAVLVLLAIGAAAFYFGSPGSTETSAAQASKDVKQEAPKSADERTAKAMERAAKDCQLSADEQKDMKYQIFKERYDTEEAGQRFAPETSASAPEGMPSYLEILSGNGHAKWAAYFVRFKGSDLEQREVYCFDTDGHLKSQSFWKNFRNAKNEIGTETYEISYGKDGQVEKDGVKYKNSESSDVTPPKTEKAPPMRFRKSQDLDFLVISK